MLPVSTKGSSFPPVIKLSAVRYLHTIANNPFTYAAAAVGYNRAGWGFCNCFIAWLCCMVFFFQVSAQQPVTVHIYNKSYTTYPFSDPDPVPNFSKIYPYFRFDGFTETPVQKEWKVIELENEYIRLLILPEVGGKIWTAIDKSTNQPFLYDNHVIKFRDVALRGPWTSGGLEANYGIIGHTPNCATPVDYNISNNADGSISCTIGVLDLLTLSNWRMEINLPRDKAYFTTRSFWYNSTATEQPYYHWMNAGLPANGNLEFIYPGNHYLGHEGEYNDWPINSKNGKNVSFYNNNNFGGYKSYHVFGAYTNFFGGYWHDQDRGMVRYGSHDDKAGKKIWIWGQSRQGMIWENYLTDTDHQYVEVQSGRMFNQNAEKSSFTPFKHISFAAYATDTWKEYWYPVHQTKGITEATPYGAFHMIPENGWLKIYFCPVQEIHDSLIVQVNGKTIYRHYLTALPEHVFTDSVYTGNNSNQYQVSLGDHKLDHEADPKKQLLNRPLETPDHFNWHTAYGLYLQGRELMDQKLYPAAALKLEASLKADSNYLPALVQMAILEYHNLLYNNALLHIRKALSIDSHDGSANYYYGIIHNRLGHTIDALDGFDIASINIEYRSAAYTELAGIYLRDHDYSRALEYCKKALDFNRYNMKALELEAITERYLKDTVAARQTTRLILSYDPLSHTAGFEQYYAHPSPAAMQDFKSSIQQEQSEQVCLQIAADYYRLGLLKESETVLQAIPENTLSRYWLAFLHALQHQPFETELQLANESSPDYVFPFREADMDMLQWVTAHCTEWKPQYYTALLLKDRNREVASRAIFDSLHEVPTYAPFYAARAELYRVQENSKRIIDLQKAVTLDTASWRYVKKLTELYNSLHDHTTALSLVEPYYQKHPDHYIIGMLLAKTLLFNQRFEAANHLLCKLQIIPFEGSTAGHELYREANLMRAIRAIELNQTEKAFTLIDSARLWPENLGAGKPYDEDLDVRLEQWLLYLCYNKQGNHKAAAMELDSIIQFNSGISNTVSNFYPANHLLTVWAYRAKAEHAKATKWLQMEASKYPDNHLLEWAVKQSQSIKIIKDQSVEEDATVRLLSRLIQLGLK